MKLGPYLALVEAGCGTMPNRELVARLGGERHAALAAIGLVRPLPPLTFWPCDKGVGRCSREIVPASASAGASERLAICSADCDDDDPCSPARISPGDLVQEKLPVSAFVRVLRLLYGLGGGATLRDEKPDGPVPLGEDEADGEPRDLFLALSPADRGFASFLALREHASRRTLVLVPTSERKPKEWATRYAPGAHVEVEVLEDALLVRDGAIVRAPRLRLVPRAAAAEMPDEAVETPAKKGIAAEIGATTWEAIAITVLDGHTVRIRCGKTTIRRTYVDLGFAGRRREPLEKWRLLLAVCAGHGTFSWKAFGSYKTAKNAVSVVRNLLKEASGLEDDPFRAYTPKDGWRVRFFASSEIGDE